ncbi:ABC transporter ATP-binding protein [Chitinophaga lutea]|uniref:ABC transporter ATP-binding protein n=1 Tax=Chitinophaga lutea TaxID=2488634 RepID=A0A3N4PXC3_9BACT|nr:ABC transporter ATP-binding protein [Chitinophaga lutea]RPE09791.1 ABC transporter ATP-binding protein [Chitinophaga lutea]
MLVARNVTKNYSNLPVLKGVDISVSKGEIVTIVGSSGAGKSTLLHILGTLDAPSGGQIFINDVQTSTLQGRKLADFRNRHIGFIFQFHHLLPEFSALENVCIPGFIAGAKKSAVKERATFLLETLGLKERLEHRPGELSGGEQQRVAVARALINKPDVIMADEPTGNLDSRNARELHQLFLQLRDQFGQTFIIVTHNEELATMSDRQLVMKDGKIVS